jgi:hypothetical protein
VNLEFCGIPSIGLDLAKNRVGSNISVAGQTHGTRPSVFGPTFVANWSNASTTDLAFTSGPFTVAIAARLLSTSSFFTTFSRGNYVSETNNQGWYTQFRSSSSIGTSMLSFRNNGSSQYMLATNVSEPTDNYVQVTRSNGVNLRELFVIRNTQTNFVSTANNANPIASTATTFVGTNDNVVSIALGWSRSLSDNEIALFNADPFCMLRQ